METLCFQGLVTNSVNMPVLHKWIFSQNYKNPSNTVYRYRQDFLKFMWKVHELEKLKQFWKITI